MLNNEEKIKRITAASKLWEGLEGQKTWNQDQPEIVAIIEGAITRLRWEIIFACQKEGTKKAKIAQPS